MEPYYISIEYYDDVDEWVVSISNMDTDAHKMSGVYETWEEAIKEIEAFLIKNGKQKAKASSLTKEEWLAMAHSVDAGNVIIKTPISELVKQMQRLEEEVGTPTQTEFSEAGAFLMKHFNPAWSDEEEVKVNSYV